MNAPLAPSTFLTAIEMAPRDPILGLKDTRDHYRGLGQGLLGSRPVEVGDPPQDAGLGLDAAGLKPRQRPDSHEAQPQKTQEKDRNP